MSKMYYISSIKASKYDKITVTDKTDDGEPFLSNSFHEKLLILYFVHFHFMNMVWIKNVIKTFLITIFIIIPCLTYFTDLLLGEGGAFPHPWARAWLCRVRPSRSTGHCEQPPETVRPIGGGETLPGDGATVHEWTTQSRYRNGRQVTIFKIYVDVKR